MTTYDPRRTPMNDRVVASHLTHLAEGQKPVVGQDRIIRSPVADLLRRPGGPRDRQLVLGEAVTLYETRDGWCFVAAAKDGYIGYMDADNLAPAAGPSTHRVSARSSHAYETASFKSSDHIALSFGSLVRVEATEAGFAKTPQGFIPCQHITSLLEKPTPDGPTTTATDLITQAQTLLGTPYLWGGNSAWGIDCSGLIQAACMACGVPCPGDSDQQEAELGTLLEPGTPYAPGDCLFWKGHIALVVTPDQILHANVHHMAVAYENIADAITRIADQGDGPVTAHKRIFNT